MKQPAVEYLVEQLLPKALSQEQYYHIEQAKEMEKEQIVKAYDQGSEAGYVLAKNDDFIEGFKMKEAEQYYNETFKTK